jgi:hypothetical protein
MIFVSHKHPPLSIQIPKDGRNHESILPMSKETCCPFCIRAHFDLSVGRWYIFCGQAGCLRHCGHPVLDVDSCPGALSLLPPKERQLLDLLATMNLSPLTIQLIMKDGSGHSLTKTQIASVKHHTASTLVSNEDGSIPVTASQPPAQQSYHIVCCTVWYMRFSFNYQSQSCPPQIPEQHVEC